LTRLAESGSHLTAPSANQSRDLKILR